MNRNERNDNLDGRADDLDNRRRVFVRSDGTIVEPDVAAHELSRDEEAPYTQMEPDTWGAK